GKKHTQTLRFCIPRLFLQMIKLLLRQQHCSYRCALRGRLALSGSGTPLLPARPFLKATHSFLRASTCDECNCTEQNRSFMIFFENSNVHFVTVISQQTTLSEARILNALN